MWTFLITLAIVSVFFMYLKTVLSNDTKQYREAYAEIFNAHKTIGYPRLTHQQQFEILDKEDLTPVSKLTKFDFVPTGLLNEYLDIEPMVLCALKISAYSSLYCLVSFERTVLRYIKNPLTIAKVMRNVHMIFRLTSKVFVKWLHSVILPLHLPCFC